MKILIFTEGTILQHKNATGESRTEIVQQVKDNEKTVHDFSTYIPIRNAVEKIKNWQKQGAEIYYLTSRKTKTELISIRDVLKRNNFPNIENLFFRKNNERYNDIAERITPDVLIEDDCESIGDEKEMTYTNIKPELKSKIKLISVKEFGGIDHLPDSINDLR